MTQDRTAVRPTPIKKTPQKNTYNYGIKARNFASRARECTKEEIHHFHQNQGLHDLASPAKPSRLVGHLVYPCNLKHGHFWKCSHLPTRYLWTTTAKPADAIHQDSPGDQWACSTEHQIEINQNWSRLNQVLYEACDSDLPASTSRSLSFSQSTNDQTFTRFFK